jgi:hypothetical protein
MSSSVPKQFPPAKSGWFYLGTPECKLDADVEALERVESGTAASEAATSSKIRSGVEASKELVEPDLQARFMKKYGPEEALARYSAKTIPASGRAKSAKGGKGKKHHGMLCKVFNPQATRPQPVISTPMNEVSVAMENSALVFTTSTSVPTYYAGQYALTSFADYTSYTSLFDEYRIHELEVWLEPATIMSSSVGSTVIASAIDLDDANVPVNFAGVAARQMVAQSETGTGHYHKWKPYVANALYSGAFTSYGSEPAPWIDCASAGVQHFGFKCATAGADGVTRAYYITVRAKVHFRGSAI